MVILDNERIKTPSDITPEYMRLLKEIEELFFYEANLLDFRQYSRWLELLGRRHALLHALGLQH